MKRLLSICGIALSIVLLLAGLTIWNRYFRIPPVDLLPLPDNLITLESSAGRELLAESEFIADYERLTANFVPQSRRAFCGAASSVIVLNALGSPGAPLDQSSFFSDSARRIKDPLRVSLSGMSLGQLGKLLRAHGVEATVIYASDTDVDHFRAIARSNLMTSEDFVLVNYQRAMLGQVEMGHISPLAAYHAETDRFLILDVAAHKYPPVWVSTDALWNAMRAPLRESSPRTRGFIVVREEASRQPAPLSLIRPASVRDGCESCRWRRRDAVAVAVLRFRLDARLVSVLAVRVAAAASGIGDSFHGNASDGGQRPSAFQPARGRHLDEGRRGMDNRV
ncbi:phytochelatin synthase family protein [Luteimonas salinilitoris]|uniref:glutathione gamma-glutamylcysteinyltransferase n=1 Tax=Luteimonas salinilitoris TaxID=3237697 RepID=A0ABV4HNY4_9GAMM